MDWKEVLQYIGLFVAVMVAAGAGFGGFWYAFKSKKEKLQKDEIAELRAMVEACEAKHTESEKAVANLQGQINSLQNIPLKDIAEKLDAIGNTNANILERLNDSARVLIEEDKVKAKATRKVKKALEAQGA